MADTATLALQVQIKALISGWERDMAESTLTAARGRREGTAEGNDLRRYHEGYAAALDRCVQALKALNP